MAHAGGQEVIPITTPTPPASVQRRPKALAKWKKHHNLDFHGEYREHKDPGVEIKKWIDAMDEPFPDDLINREYKVEAQFRTCPGCRYIYYDALPCECYTCGLDHCMDCCENRKRCRKCGGGVGDRGFLWREKSVICISHPLNDTTKP